MEIGQRVKITLGQAVTRTFQAHGIYEKVIAQSGTQSGYFFLGQTGVVVAYDEQLRMYGVMLDGATTNEDGSPDIRWFEEDGEDEQGQVIVALPESVIPAEASAGYEKYVTIKETGRRAHNEALREQMKPLQEQLEVLKENSPTLQSPVDEYDNYRRVTDDLRFRIYILERQIVSERVR